MYIVTIDTEKCTVCGECAQVCPSEIFKVTDGRIVIGNTDDCSYCQSCISVCETGAVTVTEM